eukprot:TRINITY_DN10603_c0_g1_i2.p1 TRINITY_DN10603_c0_g1~~TRINITY_DN10603_c0_g1_i2.p1  ORF type:complete len:183 (-),score=31.57 TRINITY_DN10603_c0_g1_i2:27-575(-)
MYRELQLDCLVKPVAPQLPASGMVVSDPVLTVFPHVLDDPLSLEALKYLWQKRVDGMSSKQKRDGSFLVATFRSVLLSLWPIINEIALDVEQLLPLNPKDGAKIGVVSPTDARLLTSADPQRSTARLAAFEQALGFVTLPNGKKAQKQEKSNVIAITQSIDPLYRPFSTSEVSFQNVLVTSL